MPDISGRVKKEGEFEEVPCRAQYFTSMQDGLVGSAKKLSAVHNRVLF